MVFGIDFGTTNTVIAYTLDEKMCFISFDDEILFPTNKSGIPNFKRVLLEKSLNNALLDDSILETLVQFFVFLHKTICKELNFQIEVLPCVLTVPVKFNDLARNCIKYAAIRAKFNVLKLIQEPVAATVAALKNVNKDGTYLVYDLGGGTFDVSLVKKTEDIWHVLKVDGLPDFGGIDIDRFIAEKYSLSLFEASSIKEHQYLPNLDEILQKTYDIVDHILDVHSISALILTGGSSYLQNIFEHFKEKIAIIKSGNLQTLVAEGAALFGEFYLLQSQFLIDVTPFNLGIEVLGDKMEVLIPANSPIPIQKTERFFPMNNVVAINILQGESYMASECKKLGSIIFEADTFFDVDFILDCDGILSVKAGSHLFILSDLFKDEF